MKKTFVAMILIIAILISSFSFFNVVNAETPSFPSLGTITSCKTDNGRNLIVIQGSVKHSVLIANRNSKIAVFRFDPWVDVTSALPSAEPSAVTDMSITFNFELPGATLLQKTSLYAVCLIDQDGNATLLTAPTYPDSDTSDTSDSGFKTILTSDNSAVLQSLPGSAIVDVYLDKLNLGNHSGYIYNADGDLFYFDKNSVNELDRTIRSYTATGTDVYLRFLISSEYTTLTFCSNFATWALNKCVVVDNEEALKSVYAYTAFLISRYNGKDFGGVRGIILGRGADMPILNNYASLVSEDYNTVYARSLALIGMAASEAAGNSKISLLVPITDSLTSTGKVNAEEFLYSVADYIETYSNLTFTVFCESRHNPYKISDEMFDTEIKPEITGGDTETEQTVAIDLIEEPETMPDDTAFVMSENESTVYVDVTDETNCVEDTVLTPTDTALTESVTEYIEPVSAETDASYNLQKNTSDDEYFCTDNIEVFTKMFEKLKRSHSSVNDGFAWCWYPAADTAESALGVCYAYNYMKLAAVGADFYAIGLENSLVERFQSIAHLFKYIDTSENHKETAYARSVFGIDNWSDIIDKYSGDTGVFTKLYQRELIPAIKDFSGTVTYLDYSSGKGSADWYAGYYCRSLSLKNTDGNGCLSASMELGESYFVPAEIGYVLENPEPLLVGDALTFELKCGEEDGSLYELTVYINHEDGTVVSNTAILGGVRSTLSVDVSDFDSTVLVNSIRVTVNRVTGEGPFDLNLYKVTIDDYQDSNGALRQKLEYMRDFLRADADVENESKKAGIVISVAVLTFVGIILLLMAYGSDKKKKNSGHND